MRDNYEKFPNKVLSPKLREDSVIPTGVQSMSFSGASTMLSEAISSKRAIEKHHNMNKQVDARLRLKELVLIVFDDRLGTILRR